MIWETREKDYKYPTYALTKEADPDWFAKVYAVDSRYVFTVGKRIKKDQQTPPRYTLVKKGWKSALTAKRKALEQINIYKREELSCQK